MSAQSVQGPAYRRVLLKLSGEALSGRRRQGIHEGTLRGIAGEVGEVLDLGVETAIVVGGGNIYRGLQAQQRGADRVSADHMGMLATVINALALRDVMEKQGIAARVLTAFELPTMAETYSTYRALHHLTRRRAVIFAGGTGNPFFSTDTAAALRAMEVGAEVILKATKVDGVYDSDPVKDPDARKFDRLTYQEVLKRRLRVMDATAVSLCMDNLLPIIVFNLNRKGNVRRAVCAEPLGTIIT